MAKRVISAIIGAALLFFIFILNNPIIINFAVTVVALVGLSEFYNVFKKKNYKPFEMLGYIVTLSILGIGFLENEVVKIFLFVIIPILVFVLFCKSIFTNMKYNILDIAITLFGIIYVSFFFSFIPFICNLNNGEILIWYVFGGAFITDIFAFFVGVKFGKHKITKISPKKSLEGCIGGVVGCAIAFGVYTYILNTIGAISLNWVMMTFVGIIISVISQIGDLAASSIKRFCEEKDFGSIMPGHGGVLDRFDSLIMIAPFLYMFFQFMI